MVGVINANSSTSISTQISLARQSDYMLLPGEPFPDEAQQASLSALAHTATTATISVTVTKEQETGYSSSYPAGHHDNNEHYDESSEHSGLSKGAVAGIAVGAAVGALAAAGLFFLMCRTRKLKQKLDNERVAAHGRPDPNLVSPASFGPGAGGWNQQAHMSQLPPYQGYENSDMYKRDGSITEGEMPQRSLSPQPGYNSGQFASFRGSPDPNQYR